METIKILSQKLRSGDLSSVQLTEHYLSEIDKKNKDLNAFISVNKEEALAMAKKADEMIAAGEGNELTGIPMGLKDNFCEKGVESSACSNVLKGFVAPYEGMVVSKLREMGAVFLGHTNTDEFTMGSSTESSRFGTTKNPLDIKKSPGGSSGGSAAAVAAGLCAWALGTDTGGSIRQPASFCGITGMKNTYGRVSRYGVMSMASSLDTIGSLTQTPEDAAIVLKYIAGHDPMDATTPEEKVPDYPALLEGDIKGLKIGVPQEYLEGLSDEVRAQFDAALEKAKGLGAEIIDVSLPMTGQGLAVYYVICPSEVSANMSRYDGVRMGPKSDADNLVDAYFDARTKGFGDEVKRRIIIGTYALSAGYFDAYYKKALKVRTLIKEDFQKIFDQVDVLFTPTTPSAAFDIAANSEDPIQMYLEDIMTIPASVAGVPAISIPQGSLNDLPLGLQIIGPHFGEGKVLSVAHSMAGS
jgi:aspartyl-tRNA(Asn)/glutamyl-tRNA(Gln) amidotransferase subunit A